MSSILRKSAQVVALSASSFATIMFAAQTNADLVRVDSVSLALKVARTEATRLAISVRANNLTDKRIAVDPASVSVYARFDDSAEFVQMKPGSCPLRGSGPGNYTISADRQTFTDDKPEVDVSPSKDGPTVSPIALSAHTAEVIQQLVFPSYDCFHHERRVREVFASAEWKYSDGLLSDVAARTVTSPAVPVSSK